MRNGLQVSEGSWAATDINNHNNIDNSTSHPQTDQTADDERIYLDSVKSNQAQLNNNSPSTLHIATHALKIDEEEDDSECSPASSCSSAGGSARQAEFKSTHAAVSEEACSAEVIARVSKEDGLLAKCLGGEGLSSDRVVVEVQCSSPGVDFDALD